MSDSIDRAVNAALALDWVDDPLPTCLSRAAAATAIRECLNQETEGLLESRLTIGTTVLEYITTNGLKFAVAIKHLVEDLGEDDGVLRDAYRVVSEVPVAELDAFRALWATSPNGLSYSHLVELSKLSGPERSTIATRAATEQWTALRMRNEVTAVRRATGRTNRSRQPTALRLLSSVPANRAPHQALAPSSPGQPVVPFATDLSTPLAALMELKTQAVRLQEAAEQWLDSDPRLVGVEPEVADLCGEFERVADCLDDVANQVRKRAGGRQFQTSEIGPDVVLPMEGVTP